MEIMVEDCIENRELYQEITADEDLDLVAIRPHLYVHSGSVAGNLQVRIDDSNGYQIAISNSVAIDDIRDAFHPTNNYAHGYYKFDIAAQLQSGQNYRIVLVNSGYTYASGAYASFCKDYDLRKVTANYSPSAGYNSPFDIELWIRRQI